MANRLALLTGSFTGTGQSGPVALHGPFNMSISGMGVATINLERSFDAGATWKVVETHTTDAEKTGDEPEADVLYRFNCTAYTSGTIAFRLSQ